MSHTHWHNTSSLCLLLLYLLNTAPLLSLNCDILLLSMKLRCEPETNFDTVLSLYDKVSLTRQIASNDDDGAFLRQLQLHFLSRFQHILLPNTNTRFFMVPLTHLKTGRLPFFVSCFLVDRSYIADVSTESHRCV